jgi:hypothetical protein
VTERSLSFISSTVGRLKPLLPRARIWWRERRLQVASLPQGVRNLVILTLVIIGAMVMFIILEGMAREALARYQRGPPDAPAPLLGRLFRADDLPTRGLVPRIAIVAASLGFAGVAAVLTAAALQPGWRLPRLTVSFVGLVGTYLALVLVQQADIIDYTTKYLGGDLKTRSAILVIRIAGWLGVAAMMLLVVTPLRIKRRRYSLWAFVASSPYLSMLVAFWLAHSGSYDALSEFTSVRAHIAETIMAVEATFAVIGVNALLLWQGLAGARAVSQLSVESTKRVKGLYALFSLVALKLLWTIAGYLDLLRGPYGDRASWLHSRGDGVVSWTLAVASSAALGWFLLRERWRLGHQDRFFTGAWLTIGGLLLWDALFQLITLSYGVATAAVPGVRPLPSSLTAFFSGCQRWLSDWSSWQMPAAIYVAGAAGLFMLLRRKHRPLGLFLAVFAIWALPRALVITSDSLAYPRFPVGRPADLVEGSEQVPGWIDMITLDTAITLMVAVLGVLWWRGRQRAANPRDLIIILLAMTLVAHPMEIVPGSWDHGVLFYVGVVLPVAYSLLFDADSLNEAVATRSARVLATCGITALLLTTMAVEIARDLFGPGSPTMADVGRTILTLPFTIMLVMGSLRARSGEHLGEVVGSDIDAVERVTGGPNHS